MRFFNRNLQQPSGESREETLARLRQLLREADAVVIGAGAGLSTAAGFTYSGARFEKYFSDFARRFGFRDMYSGGFYPFPTPEEFWAFWSRNIYVNRYMATPKPVYETLLELLREKDSFVITTNVDHCFQKAGFDKKRLFYTQGDYGLLQCSEPCRQETWDNEALVRKMLEAQGFTFGAGGELLPGESAPKMAVPTELLPRCPHCGKPLTLNLRSDDRFAEDEGWHRAAERYSDFLRSRSGRKLLFWEIGVGYNTPGIIKYPFWQMAAREPQAHYVCMNYDDAACPGEIAARSLCLEGDAGEMLAALKD